jgi:hypothetical protein
MHRVLGLIAMFTVSAVASAVSESPSGLAVQQMASRSIAFTQNSGQWDEQVLFRADAGGATMWFCKDRVVYQFTRRVGSSADAAMCHSRENGNPYLRMTDPLDRFNNEPDSVDQLVITARFVDANPNVEVVAEGMMEYKCNYFIGNDPTNWHTDVPNYEAITLHNIYDGVDLCFSGSADAKLIYQYSVAPGADAEQIKLEYEGIDNISPDEFGNMIAQTKWGEISGLLAFPSIDDVLGSREFSLSSSGVPNPVADGGASEQRSLQAVGLVYSTYIGGGSEDMCCSIAVDSFGSTYLTGETYSSNFPILNPYQETYQGGDCDCFVAKLSSSGNSLVYSTYLGGNDGDGGDGIAVDSSGAAYVTGHTGSADFPILNQYQTDQGGIDVFIAELSSSGNSLVYSTYLGGASNDFGDGIVVDDSGRVYVTGSTNSTDFPTLNPYQTDQGGWDIFVTKLSSSGSSLAYSTYLGGANYESPGDIAVDGSGAAYVTGCTYSSNFPILNPYQADQGGLDIFVTKLSSSGNSLVYSTYLGGSNDDHGYSIVVDGSGEAYVTGHTFSTDFPAVNPYQTDQRSEDIFVTKVSNSGNSLVYSTYVGGSDSDWGEDIAVDGSGAAYVTGYTYSTDFPTVNPYQGTLQGEYLDALVIKLSSAGDRLVYSTYIGGSNDDRGWGIAVDGSGCAYVTGYTGSSDFPTQNAFDASYNGNPDAFLTKLGSFSTDAVSDEYDESIPFAFDLLQNYPNPFNPETRINFRLSKASYARLDIFNIMGQKVATLIDASMKAGQHSVVWNGRSASGEVVASGLYFYRIEAEDFTDVKKMILLK